MFIYYFINQLLNMDKTIVWQPYNMKLAVYMTKNSAYFCRHLDSFTKELNRGETWYIVDAQPPENFPATTLLVCSPDREISKRFEKDVPELLYMPTWKLEELHKVLDIVTAHAQAQGKSSEVNREQVTQLFDRWGGIPRFCLQYANSKSKQRSLDQAIKNLDLDNLYRFIGETKGDDASHKVIHMVVFDDPDHPDRFTDFMMNFASNYVLDNVVENVVLHHKEKMTEFIKATSDEPIMAGVCGGFFEEYAHSVLCVGGSFRVRKLEQSKINDPVEIFKYDVEKVRCFKRMRQVSSLYTYYCPADDNFADADSLWLPNTVFQITVLDQHLIDGKRLHNVVDQMVAKAREENGPDAKVTMKYYFVVPDDKFDSFKWQPYKTNTTPQFDPDVTVEQYVMEVVVT